MQVWYQMFSYVNKKKHPNLPILYYNLCTSYCSFGFWYQSLTKVIEGFVTENQTQPCQRAIPAMTGQFTSQSSASNKAHKRPPP